jgi:hypothetical protein
MNPQLSNTSTIFQLAFALNAVCAVLVKHYINQTNDVSISLTEKLKQYKPDFLIEGRERRLWRYLFLSMPSYRFVRYLFIYSVIAAVFSVTIFFYYLLQASLYPNELMSIHLFIFLSVLTIIINPIYFSFFTIYLNSFSMFYDNTSKLRLTMCHFWRSILQFLKLTSF